MQRRSVMMKKKKISVLILSIAFQRASIRVDLTMLSSRLTSSEGERNNCLTFLLWYTPALLSFRPSFFKFCAGKNKKYFRRCENRYICWIFSFVPFPLTFHLARATQICACFKLFKPRWTSRFSLQLMRKLIVFLWREEKMCASAFQATGRTCRIAHFPIRQRRVELRRENGNRFSFRPLLGRRHPTIEVELEWADIESLNVSKIFATHYTI